MTRTGQNVLMHRGDHKLLEVTVLDTNNARVNIINCVMNYVIYKQNSGNIVVTKTTVSGVSITDPGNGVMEISLVPTDTEPLLGNYMHELEMTDTLGQISTILTGSFTILDSKA